MLYYPPMTAENLPRLPKNYQLVLEIVRSAGTGVHLTTNELYARAKRRRPAIGFSTVYRGIARLRDLGLIDEIVVPGSDAAVYEPSAEPHAHFRCSRCGTVQDVEYALPAQTVAAIASQTGAHIVNVTLTLHGECEACR